jgi:hypothetical protein
MDAVALLTSQWTAVNAALHALARDLSPDEWTFRVAPGQNLTGFTLWHVPACQDWTVQTWIRNVPEVRDRDTWIRRVGFDRLGLAFGISLADADAIARAVSVEDMLAYADAVLAENARWLSTVTERDLDRVPDNRAHLARRSAYGAAQYLADVEGMWLADAFAAIRRAHAQAVLVLNSPVFFTERQRVADLAITYRLPTMLDARDFVEAGGLMSYGPSYDDLYRRGAIYVDKILKGAKPADLPVQQARKFELVINLKTAKALGLTISSSVLARADELIQ